METRSNCPSLRLSFSVTWYQGLKGLPDLLEFGLEDVYRKCLFRTLLLSGKSILINRNKLKGINCTLKPKYVIHTKEIVKSITYLALFPERKISIEVKRRVTNIQSLKTKVSTFLLRIVLLPAVLLVHFYLEFFCS